MTPERQRLYRSAAWKALISACFKRDGYRCRRCRSPKLRKRWLHAHHVMPWADYPAERRRLDNLVTLCLPCHGFVHSKANVEGEYLPTG